MTKYLRVCGILFNVELVIIVLMLLFARPLMVWSAEYIIQYSEPKACDAIVILGGDEFEKRVKKADELLDADYGNLLIFSGAGNTSWVEKHFNDENNLHDETILFETQSTNTYENAVFMLKYIDDMEDMKIESLLVISSPQQSGRVRYIFPKVFEGSGVDVINTVIDDSDYKPKELFTDKVTMEYYVRNISKYVYYKLKYIWV